MITREKYKTVDYIIPTFDVTAWSGFANQPDGDGVEVVSNNAGDTGLLTIFGTVKTTGTLKYETVTLKGTTVVATTETDWDDILGAFLGDVHGDNMDRFTVIKDIYVTAPCNPVTSTGSGPATTSVVCLDEYVKLKDLESVYSGQSNPMTVADISTGALYLVMRSQYATGNSSVTVDGIARLRYKD